MKKYKLIKEYPLSLKLGTIIEEDKYGQLTTTKDDFLQIFQMNEVKKFPEFWEEIKELTYEILTFSSSKNNNAYKIGTILKNRFSDEDLNDFTYSEYWNIHSVKRLSDGEIFTIGDKVTLDDTEQFIGNISKFEIYKDNINVFYAGFDYITDITKVKTPLFITEDGMHIFGKYTLFSVGVTSKVNSLDYYKINEVTHLGLSIPNLIDFKWFNLKENAEKYIEQNKPKYSQKQIVNILREFDKDTTLYRPESDQYYIKYIKNEIKTT